MNAALPAAQLGELVMEHLTDPAATWSVGTFGAVAEFLRDPDEPAEVTRSNGQVSVVTPRGGLRIDLIDGIRPIAWERPVGAGEDWQHAVALCLPEDQCVMSRRGVVTELGPDRSALRPAQVTGVLFDLGLGTLQVDVCVRTDDPVLLRALRESAGRPLFEPGNPLGAVLAERSPHRVLLTRFARAEVYTPIPPPDGTSPEGPHTHLLPALLNHGRTHAATDPIPQGWVPCVSLFPAHPRHDAVGRPIPFDAARYDAFQQLLDRFGDPAAVAQKRAVHGAVVEGKPPESCPQPDTGPARAARRVALRQLTQRGVALPAGWRD